MEIHCILAHNTTSTYVSLRIFIRDGTYSGTWNQYIKLGNDFSCNEDMTMLIIRFNCDQN